MGFAHMANATNFDAKSSLSRARWYIHILDRPEKNLIIDGMVGCSQAAKGTKLDAKSSSSKARWASFLVVDSARCAFGKRIF